MTTAIDTSSIRELFAQRLAQAARDVPSGSQREETVRGLAKTIAKELDGTHATQLLAELELRDSGAGKMLADVLASGTGAADQTLKAIAAAHHSTPDAINAALHSAISNAPSIAEPMRLYEQCLAVKNLPEGMRLEVGGGFLFRGPPLEMRLNFSGLAGLIGNADAFYDQRAAQVAELRPWLDKQGAGVDEKLFARAWALTNALVKQQPPNVDEEKEQRRKQMYLSAKGPVDISKPFEEKCAMCSEMAALATHYLQKHGVDATFVSGAVLWDRKDEYTAAHAYVLIKSGGKTWVYDPANPIITNEGKSAYPNFVELNQNIELQDLVAKPRLHAGRVLLTNDEACYGVNAPNCSIFPRQIIG